MEYKGSIRYWRRFWIYLSYNNIQTLVMGWIFNNILHILYHSFHKYFASDFWVDICEKLSVN